MKDHQESTENLILTKQEEQSKRLARIEDILNDSLIGENYKTFSPKEIAEQLRVHYSTVLEWIKDRKLRPIQDTKYRVSGLEIKRFIRENPKYS